MITDINQIKFPPIGGTKQYLVSCEGRPFASFSSRREAEKVKEMYSTPINGASANSTKDWKIELNSNYKQDD